MAGPRRMSTEAVSDSGRLRAIQEARFQQMLDYVWSAHPYYQRMSRALGLRRSDVRSLDDLVRLPITTKDQYMAEPEAFRLEVEHLPDLSLPERALWGVIYTTGTTAGHPTPFYDTSYDNAARIAQMKAATEICGIGADDVVANCFPLTAAPHQGFWSALYGPLAVGAKVITGFTGQAVTPFPVYGSTEELARRAESQGATVLWGITSFVRRLVQVAQTLHLDYSRVRIAFVAGEPCPPGMRADLRRRLKSLGARDVFIQNGYGCTEMQGPTVQCVEGGPFHIPTPEQYWFEVVDPETHQPLRTGEPGLVLLSHLNRRGTVLLRYAVGDICALADGACPACGRLGPRFVEAPHRGDRLVKLRGTLINPAAIIDALSQVDGVDDFQVATSYADPDDPLSPEELVVRFVAAPDRTDPLADAIARAVRDACEVRPRVVAVSHAELGNLGEGYKFKRFLDERACVEAPVVSYGPFNVN